MGMDIGKKGGAKSDINVTPLVDIVLVLLIVFIVITPAVNDAVSLPAARNSQKHVGEQGVKYLNLMLPVDREKSKDGVLVPANVLLDDPDANRESGNQVGWNMTTQKGRAALVGYIQNNVSQLGDKRVFVKADAALPYKYVDELFQICREGGADEASIVTSEIKDKED